MRILPRAERDLELIFEYIRERSASGAEHWWEAFCDAAESADRNPHQYPRAPESNSAKLPLRQFLFRTRRGRTYRAIYTIVDEEVYILRVRGPGQPPLAEDEIGGT
ncbi:Plasmid stabilization system protein [Maioricimonas rarisocia]|uniref:Plasmid stabilization system protein n=1 Tax=Maioricimonas rarisocia TaxID=2528026 RepID=A0A517Z860_9PLAN|nr:Plasmid stabilization system protein [Maioricimonas rarisocia]